jgi:hypothetical protein
MDIGRLTSKFNEFKGSSPDINSEDWTESDTRSKFIDTILIGCLGWEESDIRREKYKDSDRLDYLLSTNRPILVIEAKRSSKAFPINKAPIRYKIEIKTMLKANPDLKQDFDQVGEYCRKWSVPIAVLTNGRTYIIFIAVRTDGVPIEEAEAIVIYDIFADDFNFSDLYNYLSRDVVAEGKLHAELFATLTLEPPENVISGYSGPDVVKNANAIGIALQPLLEQLFKDVSQEESPEVLEHCYVPPGSSVLRNEEFEALLLDRLPSFVSGPNVISVDSQNAFQKFQSSINQYLARQRQGQTLLVVGKVGVGKTMFLLRFFKEGFERSSESKNQTVSFFIDFRQAGLDPQKIPELVYSRLREQIDTLDGRNVPESKTESYDFYSPEGLRQVFWPEVQKLERSFDKRLLDTDKNALIRERQKLYEELRKSDQAFVKGVFRVLRQRYNRFICVILDNADLCDIDYQRAVYLFSQTLKHDLECLVIAALREEWYWYFGFKKKDGPFSAYHDTTYHIPPPRSRDVLAKRLEYAINLAKEHKLPCVAVTLPNDIVISASHLSRYLEICRKAFFDDDEITVFFECLSNGSVRKGLNAFLEFLRSGHTRVNEYLKAFAIGGAYRLIFHQVFKSIAYGQYHYYSSNHSIIPNVFTPTISINFQNITYFTRLYMLNWLYLQKDNSSPEGKGFVPIKRINDFLTSLGLDIVTQTELLEECVTSDLLEPDIRLSVDIEKRNFVRITTFGIYMLKSLCSRVCYMEAIMLDTPISDKILRSSLGRVYVEGKKPLLDERFAAISKFTAHLCQLELEEYARVQSAGLLSACPVMMPAIKKIVDEEISAIRARVIAKTLME